MKPKIASIIIMITLFLFGCGQDPVQQDLLNYLNNEMPELADLESEVLKDYESVTGPNYKNDLETYKVITGKVIPKYRNFISKLEAIQPKTSEVRELHELYIGAVNKQYNAIVQISAAIFNQDANLVVQANEKLNEGRKEIRNFHNKLQELASKHNVEILEK